MNRAHRSGMMLLALLLMLLLGSLAAMAAAEVWATTRQREREAELLFVGDQYRQAIRRYYYAAPRGRPKTYPTRLEDLLEDNRFPQPAHHLRRLYPDPMTGRPEWRLVRYGNQLIGVSSLSTDRPLKQAGFSAADIEFEGRSGYRDWVFKFTPAGSGRR
jgi:type II secretory pathway pseudopilin PulG